LDKFLSIPVLLGVIMLQVSIFSRITLLHGTADLMLVVIIAWALQQSVKSAWGWAVIGGALVSFTSAMPFLVPLIACLAGAGLARLIHRRIWQAPLLMMFLITLAGSLVSYLLGYFALLAVGVSLPAGTTFSQVVLPSILLNLLIAGPVYGLMSSLAKMIYHVTEEV
jgi:cell shape-determining protein MreD